MDAANASIQKYFVDDLSDLIDCMDFGFHQVRSLIMFFLFQISRQNLVSRAIFKNSCQMTAVWNEYILAVRGRGQRIHPEVLLTFFKLVFTF